MWLRHKENWIEKRQISKIKQERDKLAKLFQIKRRNSRKCFSFFFVQIIFLLCGFSWTKIFYHNFFYMFKLLRFSRFGKLSRIFFPSSRFSAWKCTQKAQNKWKINFSFLFVPLELIFPWDIFFLSPFFFYSFSHEYNFLHFLSSTLDAESRKKKAFNFMFFFRWGFVWWRRLMVRSAT